MTKIASRWTSSCMAFLPSSLRQDTLSALAPFPIARIASLTPFFPRSDTRAIRMVPPLTRVDSTTSASP